MDALSSETGIPVSALNQIVRGGIPELQGTWVHPFLQKMILQLSKAEQDQIKMLPDKDFEEF